jgi:hypothetical protein
VAQGDSGLAEVPVAGGGARETRTGGGDVAGGGARGRAATSTRTRD